MDILLIISLFQKLKVDIPMAVLVQRAPAGGGLSF